MSDSRNLFTEHVTRSKTSRSVWGAIWAMAVLILGLLVAVVALVSAARQDQLEMRNLRAKLNEAAIESNAAKVKTAQ